MNEDFEPLIPLGEAARILGLRSTDQALRFLGLNRVPLIRLGTRTIRVRPSDVRSLVERLVARDEDLKRVH